VGVFRCPRCYAVYYCGPDHQRKDWDHHKEYCFQVPPYLYQNKANEILHCAVEKNLFNEYQTLVVRDARSGYDLARRLLLKGVVDMILLNPVDGDMKNMMNERCERAKGSIREAYETMQNVSPTRMWDKSALHWTFIPIQLYHVIETICNEQ
jgi:hypothetical protein